MIRVKICGITSAADRDAAITAGADAIGFVLAPSPRQLTLAAATALAAERFPFVTTVAVLMDAPLADAIAVARAAAFDLIQLHGREGPDYVEALTAATGVRVIRRVHVAEDATTTALAAQIALYPSAIPLLDPGAGSGKTFAWEMARGLSPVLILSGGLTAENVADAVRAARPAAVDVSSGVERAAGKKDASRMAAFVRAAKSITISG